MQHLSDSELMKLVSQGDKPAFNQLMQRHLAAVVIYCRRYLPQDAEDIAQESFIRLWNQAANWQDKGFSVKAWLYKVSYNQCIDELRKNRPDSLDDELHYFNEQADISSEQRLSARSELQQQNQALHSLPERQRSALLLSTCSGLNHLEVAQILNISVDALEALLARGRRRLKQLFAQAQQ